MFYQARIKWFAFIIFRVYSCAMSNDLCPFRFSCKKTLVYRIIVFEVCRKQFFHFMDRLLQADISHGNYETYLPMLAERFSDISKEEVLKRVAALEFDRFLKDRYSSFDSGIGAEIESGKATFKTLEEYMLKKGEISPNRSGRQEMLEHLFNRYI